MEANNVKAMIETLEYISHYCDSEYSMDDPYCADGHILSEKAKAALLAPARNCDVGTIAEQKRRFYSEHQDTTLSAEVAIDWMQQTYKVSISERNK